MKTTKINLRIITRPFFLLIILFALFFSCDVLEPDADVLEPKVNLKEDEIYVLSNGLAFIDLNTRVTTNTPVRLSVTSSTRHGELSDLGKGLFQYLPSVGNQKAYDSFEFTVFSETNEIIKKDTIIIIVENDSTHLPCGIFPINDYVYGVKQNTPVEVNVLANDNICGYDSSDLIVTVFQPDSTFYPKHGTAKVLSNRIIYTAGNSFEGHDRLIYRVTLPAPHQTDVFGIVYFTGEQTCHARAVNDTFIIDADSISGPFYLPALANDSLCTALNNYQIHIAQAPQYGTASVAENGFNYVPHDSITADYFSDFFYYELCVDATCSTARVDIKAARDSVYTCAFKANADTIDLSGNNNPLIHFDVLHNDSLCTEITSFSVTQTPNHGVAYTTIVSGNKVIAYQRDSTTTGKNDSLEYRICNPQKCSSAKVSITLEL